MPPVTLKAHYDGEHLVLDEPFTLPTNIPLIVTVSSSEELDSERSDQAWLSMQALARAYGEDEPEYTLDDLKR